MFITTQQNTYIWCFKYGLNMIVRIYIVIPSFKDDYRIKKGILQEWHFNWNLIFCF